MCIKVIPYSKKVIFSSLGFKFHIIKIFFEFFGNSNYTHKKTLKLQSKIKLTDFYFLKLKNLVNRIELPNRKST